MNDRLRQASLDDKYVLQSGRAFMTGTQALAIQLSGLVTDNQAKLGPALTRLRQVLGTLQRDRDDLSRTIAGMAPFITAFTNVLGNGRWFDTYLDGLLQVYQPKVGGGR